MNVIVRKAKQCQTKSKSFTVAFIVIYIEIKPVLTSITSVGSHFCLFLISSQVGYQWPQEWTQNDMHAHVLTSLAKY